jgi:hypothetical protein
VGLGAVEVAGHSWLTLLKDFLRTGSPFLAIWAYAYEINGHRWSGRDSLEAPCLPWTYKVEVTEFVNGKKGRTLKVITCVGYDPF